MCTKRPTNVYKSATYIIDVSQLSHPDDVKQDNFGSWKHSGSHPLVFRVQVEEDTDYLRIIKCAPGVHGKDVVHLRRLHSVHPTNANFKRLIAFVQVSITNVTLYKFNRTFMHLHGELRQVTLFILVLSICRCFQQSTSILSCIVPHAS